MIHDDVTLSSFNSLGPIFVYYVVDKMRVKREREDSIITHCLV